MAKTTQEDIEAAYQKLGIDRAEFYKLVTFYAREAGLIRVSEEPETQRQVNPVVIDQLIVALANSSPSYLLSFSLQPLLSLDAILASENCVLDRKTIKAIRRDRAQYPQSALAESAIKDILDYDGQDFKVLLAVPDLNRSLIIQILALQTILAITDKFTKPPEKIAMPRAQEMIEAGRALVELQLLARKPERSDLRAELIALKAKYTPGG